MVRIFTVAEVEAARVRASAIVAAQTAADDERHAAERREAREAAAREQQEERDRERDRQWHRRWEKRRRAWRNFTAVTREVLEADRARKAAAYRRRYRACMEFMLRTRVGRDLAPVMTVIVREVMARR